MIVVVATRSQETSARLLNPSGLAGTKVRDMQYHDTVGTVGTLRAGPHLSFALPPIKLWVCMRFFLSRKVQIQSQAVLHAAAAASVAVVAAAAAGWQRCSN
jgi:hypothetical protein